MGVRVSRRGGVCRALIEPQIGSCWLIFCFFPDFWSNLKLPRIFNTIFGDFCQIWVDFWRFWEGLGKVGGSFFAAFSMFGGKNQFCENPAPVQAKRLFSRFEA